MDLIKHGNIKNIKAKALKLADLVVYQKSSIVSREIINKKTGTVTVFAFDKGEGLSEHTAPFDALVYILDGEAKIFISGKPHLVKKYEMIIMPANKPHSLKAVKKFKMLLVMIKS
jgi:quercetin dioxygenase-like cupin family protein